MPSQAKAETTAQPSNKGKQKESSPPSPSKPTIMADSTKTAPPNKNNKRPLPSPPADPSEKRQATGSSSTSCHLSYTDLPSDWFPSSPKSTDPQTLQLTYHKGDIFSSLTPNTVLIHACNTQGHWGAGIAKAFKTTYPKAYKAHHDFCAKEHSKSQPVPVGTTQLLAPIPGDGDVSTWIGCVFTSAKYGRMKDSQKKILESTRGAMEMLLELVRVAEKDGGEVAVIRMCKINSGKFGVPWEKTEEVLKGIAVREGWRATVEVWEP